MTLPWHLPFAKLYDFDGPVRWRQHEISLPASGGDVHPRTQWPAEKFLLRGVELKPTTI